MKEERRENRVKKKGCGKISKRKELGRGVKEERNVGKKGRHGKVSKRGRSKEKE